MTNSNTCIGCEKCVDVYDDGKTFLWCNQMMAKADCDAKGCNNAGSDK